MDKNKDILSKLNSTIEGLKTTKLSLNDSKLKFKDDVNLSDEFRDQFENMIKDIDEVEGKLEKIKSEYSHSINLILEESRNLFITTTRKSVAITAIVTIFLSISISYGQNILDYLKNSGNAPQEQVTSSYSVFLDEFKKYVDERNIQEARNIQRYIVTDFMTSRELEEYEVYSLLIDWVETISSENVIPEALASKIGAVRSVYSNNKLAYYIWLDHQIKTGEPDRVIRDQLERNDYNWTADQRFNLIQYDYRNNLLATARTMAQGFRNTYLESINNGILSLYGFEELNKAEVEIFLEKVLQPDQIEDVEITENPENIYKIGITYASTFRHATVLAHINSIKNDLEIIGFNDVITFEIPLPILNQYPSYIFFTNRGVNNELTSDQTKDFEQLLYSSTGLNETNTILRNLNDFSGRNHTIINEYVAQHQLDFIIIIGNGEFASS